MSFASVDSNVARIQTGAELTANINASPTQVSQGQDITVVMLIRNMGQAAANAVIPSGLTLTGVQNLRLSSSPETTSVTIQGGGSQEFTWGYTSVQADAGSVFFSGNASGRQLFSSIALNLWTTIRPT